MVGFVYPFHVLFILAVLAALCKTEKIRYISTEHPVITFIDKRYLTYANMTSRRHDRKDPNYYVAINFETVVYMGNNVSMNFYFFEFMTHRYERGFVELHFKMCDMMRDDQWFGLAIKEGGLKGPCPYPPGIYNLSNMTLSPKYIPRNFPFKKGRIYLNITLTSTMQVLTSGHIDMEIKEWLVKN